MRRPSSTFIALVSLVALTIASAMPAIAQDDSMDVDDERLFYIMGVAISESLSPYRPSQAEKDAVMRGVKDAFEGNAENIDPRQFRQQFGQLQKERAEIAAAEEKRLSVAFLEAEAAKPGATKTESGLIYTETKAGTGASPAATDKVKVHYHGTLRNGEVFDSSVDRGEPATFPLNRVIPCWTEGVQKMKEGGKARLVCPSDIAYGDRGSPPKISGGAALVFDVELIEIVKADE